MLRSDYGQTGSSMANKAERVWDAATEAACEAVREVEWSGVGDWSKDGGNIRKEDAVAAIRGAGKDPTACSKCGGPTYEQYEVCKDPKCGGKAGG